MSPGCRIHSFIWINVFFHPTGADRFYDIIEDMIGYRPLPLIKYCLKYVTPVICFVSCDRFSKICFRSPWCLHTRSVHLDFGEMQFPKTHDAVLCLSLFPLVKATFVFSLVKYTPLKFNNTLDYPWWGTLLGWWFTLSSTLMVPLWMVFKVAVTPGSLRTVRLPGVCSGALYPHNLQGWCMAGNTRSRPVNMT